MGVNTGPHNRQPQNTAPYRQGQVTSPVDPGASASPSSPSTSSNSAEGTLSRQHDNAPDRSHTEAPNTPRR